MQSRDIQGTAVSPGLALGPVHVIHAGPDVPTWSVSRENVPLEIGRLASALNVASEHLEERRRRVAATTGEKDAEIFAVHRLILQDPGAMKEVEKAIAEQRINAEAAVQMLITRFEATMGSLEGDSVRAYASDVSDPWRLVLDVLMERDREMVAQADLKVILAAAELTPKVATFLERDKVLGIVTETGGRFSHGAVLARSFGIPCVVGIPNLLARLEQGMTVSLDGNHGVVQLRPTEEEVDAFLLRKRSFEARRAELALDSARPVETPDGHAFGIHVNVESIRDLDTFDVSHVDGVGLLRTEFLYLERNSFPSEEEQYRMYRRVVERMNGRPVVLRLLDIGGDKPLPYFQAPVETNPALGWRGIRITLQWRDFLRVQLRAMLRASAVGDTRILLPMVTSVEEVLEIHELFDTLRAELVEQGYEIAEHVPVGAMIEVPSTLLTLTDLCKEVDFVSVGTNDLVQYLLAVDRDNSRVASLYDPQHPAVVRALQKIATRAAEANCPASVCGDISGDPAAAVLLTGMGYTSVSVAPQFVPEVKHAVRRTSMKAARALVEDVLAQSSAEGVRARLDRFRESLYGPETEPVVG